MEKAKLIITETKNNKIIKIIAQLEFENGKKMTVQQLTFEDTTLNGTGVEVEREQGQVVLVKQGEEILFSASPKSDEISKPLVEQVHQPAASKPDWRSKHIPYVRDPAYAPYNFVPLNEKVVEIPKPPESNKYDSQRNTGWIELEIEAQTPLYIRGTLTEQEVEQEVADRLENKDKKPKPDFCAPAGRIRIPGSSLRGMTRSMVEIVSFGKFSFFEDRRLYYRGLADMSSLRREYQSRMSSFDSKTKSTAYKMNAGYLIKDGHQYGIIPAQTQEGRQFGRIKKNKESTRPNDYYRFFIHNDRYIVISGDMPNKKHDWIINPPDEKSEIIWIHDDDKSSDVRDYCLDKNRNAVNLIEKLNEDRTIRLPCFYVRWMDDSRQQRVSFGHTAMFRLAYEKTIGDHVPAELKDPDKIKIDFAEAIFGNEKTHAGRVFFEDAFLDGPAPQFDVKTPKILSTPKPTTFQHYLVQNSNERSQLNHYNSNAPIRGYKLYWHKSGKRWVETDKEIEKHDTQHTKINPVEAGTKFRGRIRFENLSDEELGALLFTLDLPQGCGHKLGMGKPLGLGSIRVTPKLYLSDREARYKSLFTGWGDTLVESNQLYTKKLAFEKYVLEKLDESDKQTLWGNNRLWELLVMLRFDVGQELEKNDRIRYMRIEPTNDFKYRYVLPTPTALPSSDKINLILAEVMAEAKSHAQKVKEEN